MNKNILKLSFIIPFLLLTYGCSGKNSEIITDYSKLNEMLFVGTSKGNVLVFDTKHNEFGRINKIKGERVSRLLSSVNKNLVIETTEYTKDKVRNQVSFNTLERIYILNPNKNLFLLSERSTPGFKQYDSSLKAMDDKYIYGYVNEPLGSGDWKNKRIFRYDLNNKEITNKHFDSFSKCFVEDIFEDKNYFWYICLNNVEAIRWTTNRGNPVVLRKNKRTNEIDKITLDDTIYVGKVYIFGDDQFIWVSGQTERKFYNIFKISKSDFTYNSITLPKNVYYSDDDFLWSEISGKRIILFRKRDYKQVALDVNAAPYGNYKPSVAIDDYVYGASIKRTKRGLMSDAYNPFIIRVSLVNQNYEIIPLETTFGESLINFSGNIAGNIQSFVLNTMLLLGDGM